MRTEEAYSNNTHKDSVCAVKVQLHRYYSRKITRAPSAVRHKIYIITEMRRVEEASFRDGELYKVFNIACVCVQRTLHVDFMFSSAGVRDEIHVHHHFSHRAGR